MTTYDDHEDRDSFISARAEEYAAATLNAIAFGDRKKLKALVDDIGDQLCGDGVLERLVETACASEGKNAFGELVRKIINDAAEIKAIKDAEAIEAKRYPHSPVFAHAA